MLGNIANKIRYGVLSTTPLLSYDIPFKFWDSSQITAFLTSEEGIEAVVDSAFFTVSSPGETGTVSFVGGYTYPVGTSVLTLVRTIAIEQQTDYRNGDILDAEVLEKSLDTNVALLQQINEKLRRTIAIPVSDPDASLNIPSSLIRRNMLLGFDEDGSIIPILTTDIEAKLAEALAAENSVLAMYNDAGMTAVRTDMATPGTSKIQAVAANKDNIDTVANNIVRVNLVGFNIADVISVADNEDNINAVVADQADIGVVATDLGLGASSNVKKVATNIANVNAVAGNESNINAVNLNKTNIDAVVANASNINNVAGNKTNVDAVAGNKTNIDAVAGNATNINAVNANKINVDTVATDLLLGAASLIKITSNNIANVNLVGASIVDVNNVAAKLVEISNVSTNMASVQSAHTNMAAIIAAPTQATAAQTAKGLAETARDKAQDWAEEAEGTPVEAGQFSALHHATKAAASAASASLADAAANKQVTIDGTIYQYGLIASNGNFGIRFEEVV